ncbi:MAG TPA: patatin-like phospholipase family protein [Streptosporangiaceae bacterium]|nr:patatin-like phospholipase family protein [Streptosporangiaceae bacterium]
MSVPGPDAPEAAAAEALASIDTRVRKVLDQLHRAIAVFSGSEDGRVPAGSAESLVPTAHDLDRAIDSWRQLVPADPGARAALLHAVVRRSGLSSAMFPAVAAALGADDFRVAEAFRARYGTGIAKLMAEVPVLPPMRDFGVRAALGAQRWLDLERSFTRVALEAGEILFREGDLGDSLYVVVTGRVRMLVGEPGAERAIRDLGPGELIGEMALLTGEPRTATVAAVRDTELYRLTAESVELYLFSDVSAMRRIMATLARRLARPPSAPSAAQPSVSSVALVAAGDISPPEVARFAEVLGAFLSGHLQVAVLSPGAVEAAVGTGATADADGAEAVGLAGWLRDQEDRHDLVLYAPSPGPEAPSRDAGDPGFWDRLCVREADVVLLVGRAGASPRLGQTEQRLHAGSMARKARRELVLLHDDPRPGTWQTGQWLSLRQLSRAHHVIPDNPAHLGRLARFLLDVPVGLVLSGGGIRGFGHAGVLRALHEHGVPVDVICGTSAGALVGGQFAMGWTPGQVERRNVRLFGVPRRRLMDYTIPTTSIVGSVQLNRVLNAIFGDRRVEDLWIPYLCTITDLTAAELVVRDAGSLRDAVRASCSLPVLLPPVVGPDGHLLADGGVLNNLPVLPLVNRTALGALILVNVTEPFYAADEPYDYSDSLPLGRVLRSRLNPLGAPLVAPSIGQVLLRVMEIGSKSLESGQIARADVYIRPHFNSSSYTDTTQLPSVIRAGYEAAREALSAWDSSGIPFR